MAELRELVFVSARGQNSYFAELAAMLRHELDALGVATRESVDELPSLEPGTASVMVAPHEFAALAPAGLRVGSAQMRSTIAICTEQPGTGWHDRGARLASLAAAVFDINRSGVHALRESGISKAEHLQLGYCELIERDLGGERDVDVCFLGGATERRRRLLARYSGELWRHRCHLGFSDNLRPSGSGTPGFLAGGDKLDLLGRSRVLLNIHRGDDPYFEWARILEAIHCGAAVVSERSLNYSPLEPGRHFLAGDIETLHLVVADLLADEDQRLALAAEAIEFIRESIPLRASAERLAESGEDLLRRRAPRIPRRGIQTGPGPREPRLRELLGSLRRPDEEVPLLRRELKRARLEALEQRRRSEALAARVDRGVDPPSIVTVGATPAYEAAEPRVSVIVPLYNQRAFVAEALDSVAAARGPALELIVIDDASSDGSGDVAAEWLDAHPRLPAILMRHPVNRGLPATRNDGVAAARGDYVLPLDSDNELLPNAVELLAAALDRDPEAAFAYGVLVTFSEAGPQGLESYWDWEPERLIADNYLDALALVRRSALEELGGYTTDLRLYGWEDYDLWCRVADRGMRGIKVPEFVARYRLSDVSMISLTNLSDQEAREALAERSPRLFGRERELAAGVS